MKQSVPEKIGECERKYVENQRLPRIDLFKSQPLFSVQTIVHRGKQ